MARLVGIDIGGTTTKIVGLQNGELFNPLIVKATDPLSSSYGALGRFLSENKLQLSDLDGIMMTGVGASYVDGNIHGLPTYKVDEFLAIGLGGLHLANLKRAVIVSMGTGTAFVMAEHGQAWHLGGTGVGGGTLMGLSSSMLNIRNFHDIVDLAKDGDLGHIDLSVGDITNRDMVSLTRDTTASNFGKMSDLASKADLALGIINLIFETIGVMAVLAARNEEVRDVVLTGNLTGVPQAPEIFKRLASLFEVNFHMPTYAEYATAVGAVFASCNQVQKNLD